MNYNGSFCRREMFACGDGFRSEKPEQSEFLLTYPCFCWTEAGLPSKAFNLDAMNQGKSL